MRFVAKKVVNTVITIRMILTPGGAALSFCNARRVRLRRPRSRHRRALEPGRWARDKDVAMTPPIMRCCHDVCYEAVVNKPEAFAIGANNRQSAEKPHWPLMDPEQTLAQGTMNVSSAPTPATQA